MMNRNGGDDEGTREMAEDDEKVKGGQVVERVKVDVWEVRRIASFSVHGSSALGDISQRQRAHKATMVDRQRICGYYQL